VLDAYREAGQTSARATAALATVAEAVHSPSTTLTATRATARSSSTAGLAIDGVTGDDIGAGRALSSIQQVDLFGCNDWRA
jgi:hypothetical protein